MSGTRRGNDTAGPESSYDPTVVGVTFYTDDPETPIAGFGERERLPIPDVGEVVRIDEERLESGGDPVAPGGIERRYRVVDREFEYRRFEYDGLSGEDRCQVVVFVNVEVEPI